MRYNRLFRKWLTFTATKNAKHFTPHFIGLLPGKTNAWIATEFFLPLAACYFVSQRNITTLQKIYNIVHNLNLNLNDSLQLAINDGDIFKVKSLIAQGAILDINNHNYKQLFPSILMHPFHTTLLDLLLSAQQYTRNLYYAVLQDDPNLITDCLQENATLFTQYKM